MKHLIKVTSLSILTLLLLPTSGTASELKAAEPIKSRNDRNKKIAKSDTQAPSLPNLVPPSPFDLNLSKLPEGYSGESPSKLQLWIRKELEKSATKIDSYSSSADKELHSKAIKEIFNSANPIPFVLNAQKEYKPDARTLELKIRLNLLPLDNPLKNSRDYRHIVISRKSETLSRNISQNAYGAIRRIQSDYYTEFSLSLIPKYETSISSLQPDEHFLHYQISVAMTPDEARSNDENVRCLLIFNAAGIENFRESTSATFSDPVQTLTQTTTFTGRIIEIWIFNQKTGEILTKLK